MRLLKFINENYSEDFNSSDYEALLKRIKGDFNGDDVIEFMNLFILFDNLNKDFMKELTALMN